MEGGRREMEVDNTRATDDDGLPGYHCNECGHNGTADELDSKRSTLKCGICGSAWWEWN